MIKVTPDEKALLDFAHWVAKFVCVPDEDWEDEYCGKGWIFPELACRRLHKLGIIGMDSEGNWVYPGMPLRGTTMPSNER